MVADAEVIAVIYEVLNELGFKDFLIRINNRKLLNAVMRRVGVSGSLVKEALRAIDKLDKIGVEGVKEELMRRGIDRPVIPKIIKVISIKGSPEDVLKEVEELVEGDDEGNEGIQELSELISYLPRFGVKEEYFSIDLSLVRGLDYYTGPIFETIVKEPKIGSITGGGRYNGLIGMFTGIDVPATGTSIGIERVIDVMNELGMLEDLPRTKTRVFIATVSIDLLPKAIEIATTLRKAGISCQVDLMGRKLKKQFEYADTLGVPKVIIVGKEELKKGVVKVKDMEAREETTVKINDLVSFLRAK